MNVETIKGFKVLGRKGMHHWQPILEEWILLHERYCRLMKSEDCDAIFLYNERANVGVLASAACRSGIVSLQDAQYEKGYKYKPKWNGYADLYLVFENDEETIEAKFKWASLKSRDLTTLADEVLLSAVKDVKKTLGCKEMRGIGVAFIPLYIKNNPKNILDIEDLIKEAIGCAIDTQQHAIAWVFPKELRKPGKNAINITPGVLLIAANMEYHQG